MSSYFPTQWTDALADLKDAAHDSGVKYEATDAWAVRHAEDGEPSSFGRFDAEGEFQLIAKVASPAELRMLRFLLP